MSGTPSPRDVNPKIDPPLDRRIEPPPLLPPGWGTVVELAAHVAREQLAAGGPPQTTWDICQVYASHEKALAWRLHDEKINYFLPLQEFRRRSGDRDRRRVLPCFPGYVFLCNADRAAVRDHLRRHHRRDVLRFIDVIRPDQLERELDRLGYAIKQEKPAATMRDIKKGDLCRVAEGPLMGALGKFDRQAKRGWVTLEVTALGQAVPVEIPIEQLELV